jgi:hypothetical protein
VPIPHQTETQSTGYTNPGWRPTGTRSSRPRMEPGLAREQQEPALLRSPLLHIDLVQKSKRACCSRSPCMFSTFRTYCCLLILPERFNESNVHVILWWQPISAPICPLRIVSRLQPNTDIRKQCYCTLAALFLEAIQMARKCGS